MRATISVLVALHVLSVLTILVYYQFSNLYTQITKNLYNDLFREIFTMISLKIFTEVLKISIMINLTCFVLQAEEEVYQGADVPGGQVGAGDRGDHL